jgi:uncharacterized protein involved in response to NO
MRQPGYFMSPFLSLGFRPFFLGASIFAVVTMAAWLAAYQYGFQLQVGGLSPSQWHAHEMVFGFAMAVIAGFLLTATWNWTNEATASGVALALLFAAWALARALLLPGTGLLMAAAAADMAFMLGLLIAVARPIVKVRQKRQAPVLLGIGLLTAANLSFYLGAAGWLPRGVHYGVTGGLYLVLGMVLFMGARVIPFFTERGVGYEVRLKRQRWNDIATYVLFPSFVLSELLLPHHFSGALLAAALFALNSMRVSGWYTLGIWQKPLLWGLFAAFIMINLGFLLRALSPVTAIPDLLALHAYAVGGIGVVTVSMMARVTLGHTGRNVHQSPPVVALLLLGMVLSTLIRVFLPLIDVTHYALWVTLSGIFWILTFALFVMVFAPMLLRPRADAETSK